MQLDDSKYKVYIYNIDDELTSSESETDEGRLVFLPDIEKHLFANRVPRPVKPGDDGEIAGMQLVLYHDPGSLSIPEEQDSVRRAIIEYKARIRSRQQQNRDASSLPNASQPDVTLALPSSMLGAAASTSPIRMEDDPDTMDLS
jgi:hypothetical protein